MKVFPLFPSLVAVDYIEQDINELNAISNYQYHQVSISGGESTVRYNILDDFPKSKEIIVSRFKKFIKETLQLSHNNFDITTSWGTRHSTNQFSDLHNHKNCFYSSVLYLQDIDPNDGGQLCFSSVGVEKSSYLLQRSTTPNQYNTDSFFIQPEKNCLVFFPSYLMHRVMPYTGKLNRYSIAINYIPKGMYGEADSSTYIESTRCSPQIL